LQRYFALIFATMDINCTKQELEVLQQIADAAAQLQMPCFLIGGFVRDKMLNRPTKDMDIVCMGDGIVLAEKVADCFSPRPQVSFFKTFGTAQIKTDWVEIEFVGARKESYSYNSRKPTVAVGTLEDDQNRRDFTINALAISLNATDFGKLIDPFDGITDMENGLLRTPLQPGQTFSDDPLRMMRGIRFASQLGFTIVPETLAAIAQYNERIKIVSGERIADR
jgi:poly(A) polymerase